MNPFLDENDAVDPRTMFSVKMGHPSGNLGSLENNYDPGTQGDPMAVNCRKDMPDRYPAGDGDRYSGQASVSAGDNS